LYEDLKSFCTQNYPAYQIVFGLRDPADPAREVAERLRAEHPDVPIDIVIDPRLHGSNKKVSNLINMQPCAKHSVLVIVDSDVVVEPDYLTAVTAPLLDPNVGLVTCIYRSLPTPGVWSQLGAMYINEWYVPTVLLAWLFGHRRYVSGQTMCLRQETLRSIGGFWAAANHLADDYRLGELVGNLGLRVILSPYRVEAEHHEPSFNAMMRHEARWMQTLRALRPRSFCGLFLTFNVPLSAFGMTIAVVGGSDLTTAYTLFAVALCLRCTLHLLQFSHRRGAWLSGLWMVPIRDLLLCWVWSQTFWSSRITWRGHEFELAPGGLMRQHKQPGIGAPPFSRADDFGWVGRMSPFGARPKGSRHKEIGQSDFPENR